MIRRAERLKERVCGHGGEPGRVVRNLFCPSALRILIAATRQEQHLHGQSESTQQKIHYLLCSAHSSLKSPRA